jgi:hypothetical protein
MVGALGRGPFDPYLSCIQGCGKFLEALGEIGEYPLGGCSDSTCAVLSEQAPGASALNSLRGHPKPAMQGHLRSGHTEGMDCGRNLDSGKAGSGTALDIAPRFPLSHNINNNITL